VQEVVRRHGKLNILVNNAGIGSTGGPMISSPVPMPLYTDAKRACEDEDRELRRQAILGMAHYRSARAFAVNPARLRARPCGLWGLTAQRGQAKRSLMR
jgi:NAD(P)-dependent dehydrogenase (short-subunit alcohol dehydrogenase family)